LIQTETEFEAKFTSGSNPQMELLFEGTDSIVEKGIGMIRQMTFDYVFSTPLIYNVTSVARNSLGKKTITNLRVEVIRSVKGFSVEMKSSLINSYSNMTFTIRLDNSDRLPMGTMQLFVDFDDGSLLNMTVNDKYDAKLTHVMFTFFFPPVVYGYCLVMDISYSNTMVSLTPEWDSSYLNIHVTFVGVSFLVTMLMVKMMMPLGIGIIYGGCGLICNAGIGYCTAILYW
jgi:hypothetical protein